MKTLKLLSAFLCLCIIFACCGCNNKAEDNNSDISSVESLPHSMNILAYAEKGEIPEVPYQLGANIDNLKETFMDHIEAGSEIHGLEISEGENTVWLDGGSMMFCYEKAKAEQGISVLIAREYAYDFSLGGVYATDDVISAVGSEKYVKAAATNKDAFFLPVIPDNCECITYNAGSYILKFIFIDDYLSAVTLTDSNNWSN